jgi:hypothetical protein
MKNIRLRLSILALTFTVGIASAALFVNARVFSNPVIALASVDDEYSAPSQPKDKSRQEGIEAEEYAVYSTLINGNTGEDNVNRPLIILDKPSAWIGMIDSERDKFYEDLQKSSPALMPETLLDLIAKNKEQYTFTRRFEIKRPYTLISEKELDNFFNQDGGGWEEFYRKYPESRGYSTFSRVGFNADKTQALVYQAHGCGGLCGGGAYVLLVKKNGVWVSKGSIGPTWVS